MPPTLSQIFISKMYPSPSHLQEHMCKHTGERPFQCGVCDKAFSSKHTLKQHLVTHAPPQFNCNVCDKQFYYKQHLVNHLLNHTGMGKYKCDICNKLYNHIGNYKAHVLSHTDEKPHVCEVCGEAYKHGSSLQNHISKVHTGVARLNCELCDYTTQWHTCMKRHMNSHTGTKPYECDECGKHVTDLKTHKMTHTGEKPFQCEICEQKFAQKQKLKRHMNTKHSTDKA